ncbi:MAG: hypothetical protein HQ495_06010 [Alphaproteobacteria bacterium]|nr:hypothetical protein [Alphaproteobacteria bacterium]
MAVFLVFLATQWSGAVAQNAAPETTSGVGKIALSRASCVAIIRYVDTGDAAFKPGVDVHGRPVVGANISEPSTTDVSSDITFTLTLRLGDFGPGIASGLVDSTASVGEVSIRGNNVLLNGQSLSDAQANTLALACKTQIEESKRP